MYTLMVMMIIIVVGFFRGGVKWIGIIDFGRKRRQQMYQIGIAATFQKQVIEGALLESLG